MMWQTGYCGDYNGEGSGSSGVSCQDCGNQAKKECEHKRCRTCCRSRGLPCKTHVKSTWVPAAKRRERDQQLSLSTQQPNPDNHHIHGGWGDLAMLSTHHHNTPGFHLPAEVTSSAVFQCVKVSGMDERNEQFAYQTSIRVGGHVFSGILYDHGPEQGHYNHLIERSSSITTTTNQPITIINNSSMYPTSHYSFMDGNFGKPFFPPSSS